MTGMPWSNYVGKLRDEAGRTCGLWEALAPEGFDLGRDHQEV
jgi:hypothetical protein